MLRKETPASDPSSKTPGPVASSQKLFSYCNSGYVHGLLIEVVTNPGPVREKMLDIHLITDQRKIRTEHRTGGRIQGKSTRLNQADHDECGEALNSARNRELGVDVVGDAMPPVCQPKRGRPRLPPAPIHTDHAGESRIDSALRHLSYDVGHERTFHQI
jgi:hypothetical protein